MTALKNRAISSMDQEMESQESVAQTQQLQQQKEALQAKEHVASPALPMVCNFLPTVKTVVDTTNASMELWLKNHARTATSMI